jgi:hypothetical protein
MGRETMSKYSKAMDIVERLAGWGPYWENLEEDIQFETGNDIYCSLCGEQFVSSDYIDDERLHADNCPWRLAKEYIANLYNEGYDWEQDGVMEENNE